MAFSGPTITQEQYSLYCVLQTKQSYVSINRSISDMKVSSHSISDGNNSRKKQEERLISKIGTTHLHGLNERFSFIKSSVSFYMSLFIYPSKTIVFHLTWADKSTDKNSILFILLVLFILFVTPPPT